MKRDLNEKEILLKIILDQISRIRSLVDYIVLIFHWGLDNSSYPIPWQRRHAKEFIAAGADLIVGHHPHVLQGYEKIDNSWVFYSLGNFAFAPLKHGKENDLSKRQKNSIILNWIIDHSKHYVDWAPIKLNGLEVERLRSLDV